MICLTRSVVSASRTLLPHTYYQLAPIPAWHSTRCFQSTATARKKIDFAQKQVSEADIPAKEVRSTETNEMNKKDTKKHGGKTSSLRRVAVEAQWSRQGFVKGRGSKRFVDPHVDTKVGMITSKNTLHGDLTMYADSYCLLRCGDLQHLHGGPPRPSSRL